MTAPARGRVGPSPHTTTPRRVLRTTGLTAAARRRATRARIRRNRLIAALLLVGAVTLVVSSFAGGGGKAASRRPARIPGATPAAGALAPAGLPAAEAGLLPWRLAAPISRELLLRGDRGGQLLIAGGISGSGSSDQGVYSLDSANGSLVQIGHLTAPTHDAAGGTVGATAIVAGGGDTVPVATTNVLRSDGTSVSAATLPRPRADAAAATIGSVLYIVGGYDGSVLDASVLETTDGRHFQLAATLPVPVRYPAVAALGGEIYVFGGMSASGKPVDDVQIIDPSQHTAKVAGTLPEALSGAMAASIDGKVFVAGGETSVAGSLRPVAEVLELDPTTGRLLRAGALPLAVAYGGIAALGGRAYIVGGETAGGSLTAAIQMIQPNPAFGRAGAAGAGSPYYGYELLVADRGNNRLVLLDDTGKIIWVYPSARWPGPPGGLYFPDDAFFIDHGKAIISNQEDNQTIVEIAYPSGKIIWSYGHARRPGSVPGYLDNPDDAYLLRDGDITVADTVNCRVLVISPAKRVLTQIGTPGVCAHGPPGTVGSPNGDTPLADGNLLVSEINGSWVDEYTTSGRLVWAAQLPIAYPSDPQQIGPDRYLIADYSTPGALVEFDNKGQILYRYGPASGPGELNQPSLVEQLPSGVLMANDDYNDRMVAIDPATGALVWQYGAKGQPGTAPGQLSIPDGFDIVGPGGVTPTHSATG